EFLAATEVDAKNVVAFYDLGVAQAHLSNLAEAADAERQAVALDEKYTVAYIELGWILTRLGDFDAAAQAEEKALQLEPASKIAQRNLEAIGVARRAAERLRPAPSPVRSPI